MKLFPCLGCCNSPESLFVQGYISFVFKKQDTYLAEHLITSLELIRKRSLKAKWELRSRELKRSVSLSTETTQNKQTKKRRKKEKKEKKENDIFPFPPPPDFFVYTQVLLKRLGYYMLNKLNKDVTTNVFPIFRKVVRNVLYILNTDNFPTI